MFSENSLRRRASKIGYRVVKGRRNHGCDGHGFMVLNPDMNCVVRDTIDGLTFCMDHDDVEGFLMNEYESLGMSW